MEIDKVGKRRKVTRARWDKGDDDEGRLVDRIQIHKYTSTQIRKYSDGEVAALVIHFSFVKGVRCI